MVCPSGHGVLFCAGPQPSPERDQWNLFDDSWSDLFAVNHNALRPSSGWPPGSTKSQSRNRN
jgi:hypothetical protein